MSGTMKNEIHEACGNWSAIAKILSDFDDRLAVLEEDMKRRKADFSHEGAESTEAKRCPKCGKAEDHFVPPSICDAGFYTCDPMAID